MIQVDGDNFSISSVKFDCNEDGQSAWDEQVYGIRIQAADNAIVRDCNFYDIMGDGIILTRAIDDVSAYAGPTNTLIENCGFYAEHDNRQGISVIGINGGRITGCYFYHMTKAGMPGSIDLEPDNANETITNLTISDNTIVHADTHPDSGFAAIGIIIYNAVNAEIHNISVIDNTFTGGFAAGISIVGGGTATALTDITVRGNVMVDMVYNGNIYPSRIIEGIAIKTAGGVLVEDNTISMDTAVQSGYTCAIGIENPDGTVVIKGNILSATDTCTYGILSWDSSPSSRVEIHDNTLTGFQRWGILAQSRGDIYNNTLIDIGSSAYVSNPAAGIWVESDNNAIYGNSISGGDNMHYGISLSGSSVVGTSAWGNRIENAITANTRFYANAIGGPDGGVFNVADYGATGDGVTDDSAAIQAAIDACEAAGGGEVYFPSGTYIADNMTIDDDFVHVTSGGGVTIKPNTLGVSGTPMEIFTVSGDSCSVSNLYLDLGDPYNVDFNYGVYGNGANGLTVEGVSVLGSGYAISTINSDNVSIRQCSVSGYAEYGVLVWGDADGIIIEGNICRDASGSVTANGIKLAGASSGSATNVTNATIVGNVCINNRSGIDVAINEGEGIIIDGNVIDNSAMTLAGYAINMKFNTFSYVDTTVTIENVVISNNTIKTSTTASVSGINVQREINEPFMTDILVTGNSISGPAPHSTTSRDGIRVYGANGATISSNNITGYRRGILIADCDSTYVSSNIIRDTFLPLFFDKQMPKMSMDDNTAIGNTLWAVKSVSGAFYDNAIEVDTGASGTRLVGNYMQTGNSSTPHVNDSGTGTVLSLAPGADLMALSGAGTPENAITANIGSTYQRTDGGAGTSLYVKESGTGNTGWVAK